MSRLETLQLQEVDAGAGLETKLDPKVNRAQHDEGITHGHSRHPAIT